MPVSRSRRGRESESDALPTVHGATKRLGMSCKNLAPRYKIVRSRFRVFTETSR